MSRNKENETENPALRPDRAVDPSVVADFYSQYSREIQLFLVGLLRDPQLADDVLQTTFIRLAERGGDVAREKMKSWLFQVAYNEAIGIRRREKTGDKVFRRVAWSAELSTDSPELGLVKSESVESVRRAIQELPENQQQVVKMRIYEEKTFATIAEELKIPLGTALGRMRTALKRLRSHLQELNQKD